jgi:hypothetical protein
VAKGLSGPGGVGGYFHYHGFEEGQHGFFLAGIEPVEGGGLIRPGQGCSPADGRNRDPRSFAAAGFSGEERPTIRSVPSTGRPATMAFGRSMGPMTAAQTVDRFSVLDLQPYLHQVR